MTFQQELQSWLSPTALETSPIPQPGTRAPSTEALSFPLQEKKPAVVTFLRHCGCPCMYLFSRVYPDINTD